MRDRKNHFLKEPKRRGREAPVISCGCPMVRYRAAWCMSLCEPIRGIGTCGRLAPHAMLGKTQKAILQYKNRTGTFGCDAAIG